MSDEQLAPNRVADPAPTPADSNAPGAVNVDSEGNALSTDAQSDGQASGNPAPGDPAPGRRARSSSDSAPLSAAEAAPSQE